MLFAHAAAHMTVAELLQFASLLHCGSGLSV